MPLLTTIGALRERISFDQPGLIKELQQRTGRFGSAEAEAWSRSLPKLSNAFSDASFQPFHLYFGSRGNLALEYQLPAASSWCDVVLLGSHANRPAVVIVELKDWMLRGDRPGRAEGLIERQGRQDLHPSDQVRGYVEYCKRFHSAVALYDALVHGCVLFTNERWTAAYAEPPNADLVSQYPIFADSTSDSRSALPAFFSERLTEVDEPFARNFAEGEYRQDRGFVAQIGAQILNPEVKIFELLDNQRRAFSLCHATIIEGFDSGSSSPPKRVVIIKGPPGSGKSVIAARLWASLVTNSTVPEGDVVFTTTSMSQNSNWQHLFAKAAQLGGSSGIVRKANQFMPVTMPRLAQLRGAHGQDFLHPPEDWRQNLSILRGLGESARSGARDNDNLVSIVDEAHALINAEHPSGRGQFGFDPALGPQAFHIIRSSLVTVFLLDPEQGFRSRENTTIEDLRRWSSEAGAGAPEEISLDGMQFRCGGSPEYVTWVEGLLDGATEESNRATASTWQRNDDWSMKVAVFSDPESWQSALESLLMHTKKVRLVSSFSRAWKTMNDANPHLLPPTLQDFHESYVLDGKVKTWSRVWNHAPNFDYSWFVSGVPGSYIAQDPLCEVGCPYAVRGFDFDYVGIAWLDDLLWRSGSWNVNASSVKETGITGLARARREQEHGHQGPASREVAHRVKQAYRILLTRALKGVFLWIPDEETREHVQRSLSY